MVRLIRLRLWLAGIGWKRVSMILILVRSFTTILRMVTPETSRQSARRIFSVWCSCYHQPPFCLGHVATSAIYNKVAHDNRTAEISTWFTEESLKCSDFKTAHLHFARGFRRARYIRAPASLWPLQELRSLHGRYDCFTRCDIPMPHRKSRHKKTARNLHTSSGIQNPIVSGCKRHGTALH